VKRKIRIVSEIGLPRDLYIEPEDLKEAFLKFGLVKVKKNGKIIGRVIAVKIENDKVLIEAEIQEGAIDLKSGSRFARDE